MKTAIYVLKDSEIFEFINVMHGSHPKLINNQTNR